MRCPQRSLSRSHWRIQCLSGRAAADTSPLDLEYRVETRQPRINCNSIGPMDAIALPNELSEPGVPRHVLEDYVLARIRQFSSAFVHTLLGEAGASLPLDLAFNQTVLLLDSKQQQQQQEQESFYLRFTHRCKFLGCKSKECTLCINNPNKRCSESDNFDECFSDNQVLKSKCDADVYVELLSKTTGKPGGSGVNGTEVQISVIDGESIGSGGSMRIENAKELCKSDEGGLLLGAHMTDTKSDGYGRRFLKLQDASCRLPDLYITDKNDTFHMEGHTYSSFRLMARVVQRDFMGNAVVMEHITPAISEKFIVKTQRALNDYRKSEYPHYKDELTKLKYIGSITAQRLRDIQAHVANVPFTVVETVEQLKHLMLYADQNRQVEAKLLEILNMKGKHKHKWEYLREVLLEKIVYDDMVHRAWFTDETMTQGLLFACKQGQINMDKPFGIAQRITQGSQSRLQVLSPTDPSSQELLKAWRVAADESWSQPGHLGWVVVSEPLELVSMTGAGGQMSGQMSMSTGARQSISDAIDGMQVGKGKRQVGHSGQVSFPAYYNSSSAAAGGQVDTASGPFQFTSARVNQQSGAVRASSGGGGTPRSEAGPPSAQQGDVASAGPFNPFAQVARGPTPPPEPEFFRPSSGGSQTFHHPPPFEAHRQTSAPHPFAMAAHMKYEHTMDAARVCSTPAFPQSAPSGVILEAYRGASTPEPASSMLPDDNSAAALFGQAGRLPSSRFRRMSAADVEHMEHHLQAFKETQAPARGLADTKRPRASVPVGLTVVETRLEDPAFDRLAQIANSSLFYHTESLGRHCPRSRMSLEPGELGEQPPLAEQPQLVEQQQLTGQQLDHAGAAEPHQLQQSDDQMLTGLLQLAVQQQQAAAGPAGLPASPAHCLSASMQDSLRLAEGSSDNGAAESSRATLDPQSSSGVQEEAAPGRLGNSAAQSTLPESDSFQRTLGRILRHSESDSFKHMLDQHLDVNFNSPTGHEQQNALEFASFLETFAGQEQL